VVGFRIRSVGHEKGPEVSAPGLFFVKNAGYGECISGRPEKYRNQMSQEEGNIFCFTKGEVNKEERRV
jgi:hypothetical protein